MAVILKVEGLEVEFSVRGQRLKAIRKASLDLYEKETLAIVGESGSGKSVLIKSLTGMLEENGEITKGSIKFEGMDLATLKKNSQWQGIRGKKIATVFQDPMTALNPMRRVGSQIEEAIQLHSGESRKSARKKAIELMEKVGIEGAASRFSQYPHEFSGGMRQRIVIAIALACQPKVLLCDEPTTALDVRVQAQILDLISGLQEELGLTVIYITHDLGVVASVADRVAIMYAGQIVEYGGVEDIFYRCAHPYTWALLSSLPQLAFGNEGIYAIGGTPPSLYHDIKGDAFAPRNPYALKIDFEEEPPFFKVGDGHYAKTWLMDPRAPKVKRPKALQNLHGRLKEIYP
ncbi:MAG: ABC transporter ATP-binding protein [Turicibacter sp.]|nr:ABC transporter ATP-binding protein [Turicibacter sp.]